MAVDCCVLLKFVDGGFLDFRGGLNFVGGHKRSESLIFVVQA